MNTFEKSESIKTSLRQGFQDGSSKMAKRKCYGYTVSAKGQLVINSDEAQVFAGYLSGIWLATVLEKSPPVWSDKASHPQRASPSGIVKQLTSCSPMKNTRGECCFKKRLALAFLKLKTMASWIGISTPTPMRPLSLTRCLRQFSRRNSGERKILKRHLPCASHFNNKRSSDVQRIPRI